MLVKAIFFGTLGVLFLGMMAMQIAGHHYGARRIARTPLVAEANAIGTAYLRLDLLPAQALEQGSSPSTRSISCFGMCGPRCGDDAAECRRMDAKDARRSEDDRPSRKREAASFSP